MAERGHQVHVVSLRQAAIPGAAVHHIKPFPWVGKLNYLLCRRRFIRKIEAIAPDVVDVQFLTSGGFIARQLKHIPLVATAWGSDVLVSARKWRFFANVVKEICAQAATVVAVSDEIATELNRLGVEVGKIEIFPLGVDLFQCEQPGTRLPNTPLTILSTRWHEPIYNLELLIKAIPIVLAALPDARFIIAGDGSLKAKLESMVRKLQVSGNVQFLGRVEHLALRKLYSEVDIYVSTALSDGSSESLLEAFAGGAFPVVTDIRANKSWVVEGVNGLLVPTKGPDILAAKIIEAGSCQQLRMQAADYNSQIVREKANFNHNMAHLETIYVNCLQ